MMKTDSLIFKFRQSHSDMAKEWDEKISKFSEALPRPLRLKPFLELLELFFWIGVLTAKDDQENLIRLERGN